MKRILIVEDEAAIREFEAINLKRVGYNVAEAGSGEEALDIYDNDVEGFDIALLDISMPGMDGFALCKELRKRSETLGIIMLTARTQEMDKISGLMMGADDYITKPFSPTELLARVDSLYRRVEMHSAKQAVASSDDITLGEFTLNLRRRTLLKSGVNIELTQVEFQMIEYFFNNPDTALDRTDILNKVWGSNYFGEEKIVDVNIRRLRKKIEDNPSDPKRLVTVWGMGYKWNSHYNRYKKFIKGADSMQLEIRFKSIAVRWFLNIFLIVAAVIVVAVVAFSALFSSIYTERIEVLATDYAYEFYALSGTDSKTFKDTAVEIAGEFQYKNKIEVQVIDLNGQILVSTSGFQSEN